MTSDHLPGLDESSMDASRDSDALNAEVIKWQERVPKLASALRERSDQLATAREEIRDLQQAKDTVSDATQDEEPDARVRARDEVIAELESRVAELNARHREAAGQLHRAQLDLEDARHAVESWKGKWQSVTNSLDREVSGSFARGKAYDSSHREWEDQRKNLDQSHQDELERAKQDAVSLRERNENLSETTELANKQIATLGEEFGQLVEQNKAQREALNERVNELQVQAKEMEQVVEQKSDAVASKEVLASELEELAKRRQDLAVQLQVAQENQAATLKEFGELQGTHLALTARHEELQIDDQARIESLEKLVAQKESDLTVKAAQSDGTSDDNRQLKSQLANVQSELDELQKRLGDQGSQTQVLQREFAANTLVHLESVAELKRSLEAAQIEREGVVAGQAAWAQEKAELQAKVATFEGERASVQESLEEQTHASAVLKGEYQERIKRLASRIEQTEARSQKFDEERSRIGSAVTKLTEANDKLKHNLEKRSQRVVDLEADLHERSSKPNEFATELARVSKELTQAQHRAQTFEEHARTLDEKLTVRQSLMEDLETELSESTASSAEMVKQAERAMQTSANQASILEDKLAKVQADLDVSTQKIDEQQAAMTGQEETVAKLAEKNLKETSAKQAYPDGLIDGPERGHRAEGISSVAADKDAVALREDVRLREEVRELQGVLRERTEELNEIRWRQGQESADVDQSIVLILNRQLKDAHEENERLRKRMQVEKSEAADFAMIKGIGERLASQLKDLGIEQFAQIANLTERDLENESHALHQFKIRMLRDDWIGQAKRLIQD